MIPVCSVLIPTRNRVEALRGAVESYWAQATDPTQVEIVVRAHEDDPATMEWARVRDRRVRVVVGDTGDSYGSMSEFVNCLAAVAHGDWLWPASDDWRVTTRGWDRILAERLDRPREVPMLLSSTLPDKRLSIVSRGLYRITGHMGLTEHGDSYMSSLSHFGGVHGKVAIDMQDLGLPEVGPRDRVKTWAEFRGPETAWCFDLDKRKLGAVLGRAMPGWTTSNAPQDP